MTVQPVITNRNESRAIRWSEPDLPTKLSVLLDRKMTFDEMPLVGPISAQALRDYIAGSEPPSASEDQIGRMMTRIANMMPSPRLNEDEAKERMATYRRALGRHALPDLHEAFDVILRRCRFFPTVAEIEEIVAPIRAKRMARINRADMLITKHEREWTPPIDDLVDPKQIENLRSRTSACLGSDPQASNERPPE